MARASEAVQYLFFSFSFFLFLQLVLRCFFVHLIFLYCLHSPFGGLLLCFSLIILHNVGCFSTILHPHNYDLRKRRGVIMLLVIIIVVLSIARCYRQVEYTALFQVQIFLCIKLQKLYPRPHIITHTRTHARTRTTPHHTTKHTHTHHTTNTHTQPTHTHNQHIHTEAH